MPTIGRFTEQTARRLATFRLEMPLRLRMSQDVLTATALPMAIRIRAATGDRRRLGAATHAPTRNRRSLWRMN